jgi:putative ABC transport system permease protein
MTLVGLAARNVLRNKFRAVLTIAGVAVAILAFIMLRTVVMAWTVGADFAVKDRLFTRHKITFVMTLPKRYITDLRAAPHVRVATFSNWFGGKDPKHDREFFQALAVDSATYFDVFDDYGVAPDVRAAWMKDPQGAIVGDVLAKKMGWKVGDKVLLESGIYPDLPEWEFHVTGFYTPKAKSADRSTFHFHWDYLNKNIAVARQDQIGWMAARVDDPSRTADVGLAVDKIFDEREVPTLSQDERSFATSFLAGVSAVLAALDLISGVIMVIMMLVLGNTIAMGARERTNEYGVLKALGFSGSHLAGFILGEGVILAGIGGALGIALSYPIVEGALGRYLEENVGAFFPYFRVDAKVAAAALGLALLLGAVASAIPAALASRLRVVDALRRVA